MWALSSALTETTSPSASRLGIATPIIAVTLFTEPKKPHRLVRL